MILFGQFYIFYSTVLHFLLLNFFNIFIVSKENDLRDECNKHCGPESSCRKASGRAAFYYTSCSIKTTTLK